MPKFPSVTKVQFSTLLLISVISPVFAAQAFTDNFSKLKKEWSGKDFAVADGSMILKNKDKDSENSVFLSMPTTDVDEQVTVSIVDSDKIPANKASSDYGGLIFWGVDTDSFMMFKVSSQRAMVSQVSKGNWTHLVDFTCKDVKYGPGVSNVLRVVTRGGHLTCYLNGNQLCQRDLQPPSGSLKCGLYSSDTDIAFKDFSLKY